MVANLELNEWTFAADACKWVGQILTDNSELPFSEAKVEQGSKTSRKRRDVTLYGIDGQPVLTGEIKLPDRVDGQSPYSAALVDDAFEKANARGVEYFFTWNVNRFVLWKTFEARKPVADRHLEHFNVTSITQSEDLTDGSVQTEIRGFLTQFLARFARILAGTEPILSRPLDEKFIRVLESALELPTLQTQRAIEAKYIANKKFATEMNEWMRDAQGWTITTSPQGVRQTLERAAKLSCYVLANKIVFQQALRRRFPVRKLRIPETVKKASELQQVFQGFFEEAKRVSHDYETVFDGDMGDTLPFVAEAAVPSWREFVREIDGFDFAKIGYDIIGHIFERLISPAERHRYGQHYTRSEVVDLINAFSIRTPNSVVLDPACGGGTFLVRAYVHKKELSEGKLDHQELLPQIKGIDLSAFAAHLATINLATRDLIDEKNYPLVAREDFFHAKRGRAIFHVPLSAHGKGKQTVPLEVGEVDAVVGNPPYVRQEVLSPTYKRDLQAIVEEEFPDAKLSGRSDLHCYFWPHATSFLKEGGYFGFLTSSAWLDVEYGFRLQDWLLRHFAILALFESNCEPWFTGARVTTVATLLRREGAAEKRATNTVRFVQLRRPLKEVLESFDTDAVRASRLLRDFIEQQHQNVLDDRWRIRLVNQDDLHKEGLSGDDSYKGGKWGIHLRAPDIFFKLLDRCGTKLVPLGSIAEIRRGVTSGADDFFFVRDVTEDEISISAEGIPTGDPRIERRFREKWGVSLSDADRIRVIEAGDGSRHLVEADYLEPEVHSLMGLESLEIDPARLSRKILLVSEAPEKLKGTYALQYIRWGEREGFDQGTTCAARARVRPWYDVTGSPRARLLWQKTHKYRHAAPLNPKLLIANCRMYTIQPVFKSESAFAAVLNSTIVALTKALFGRFYGTEGTLDTEIVDCNFMLVPDLRDVPAEILRKLEVWISSYKGESVRHLIDELETTKRIELDHIVLQTLGFTDKGEREDLVKQLHDAVRKLHEEYRAVELKANLNKRVTARQDRPTPKSIAQEIWEELNNEIMDFPAEFLPSNEKTEILVVPSGKPKILDDLFHQGAVQINGTVIQLSSKERAEFVAQLADLGYSGPLPVPISEKACHKALESFRRYENRMTQRFKRHAEERSADAEVQTRIVRELTKLFYAAIRHRKLVKPATSPSSTVRSHRA